MVGRGKKFGEGRRITLRLRKGVDESLGRSYELCRLLRKGGGGESLNDFINRLLFEKSEEMLVVSRRSKELRGGGGGYGMRDGLGESETDRRLRELRKEFGV